jgi:hypothetical protein
MSETPNAEYFIASLHNAGWEGTLDAQHEKIEALWKRITDERKRELAAMTGRADVLQGDCDLLNAKDVSKTREINLLVGEHRQLAADLAAMTAEKELAERQVTLLAGTLAADINKYPCGSMSWSADQWAAWSRAEAQGGPHA